MFCLFEAKNTPIFFVPDFFQNNNRKIIFISIILGVSAPSLPMAVGNGTTPTRNKTKDKGKKGKAKLTKQDIGTPTDFRYVPMIKTWKRKY